MARTSLYGFAPSLACKYQTRLEVTGRDKHSSKCPKFSTTVNHFTVEAGSARRLATFHTFAFLDRKEPSILDYSAGTPQEVFFDLFCRELQKCEK
jgi:hypothetical protein